MVDDTDSRRKAENSVSGSLPSGQSARSGEGITCFQGRLSRVNCWVQGSYRKTAIKDLGQYHKDKSQEKFESTCSEDQSDYEDSSVLS